jgi:hypothetical protein
MTTRRIAFVLVVVALLAAGIGMVFLGGDRGGATELGGYGGTDAGGVPISGDTASPLPAASPTTIVDPAKVEPNLDKFTSKDPFAAMSGTIPTITPTTPVETPTAAPTTSPENPSSADVTILGSTSTVKAGQDTPTADPVFQVASITPDGVTFELLNDQQFDDGSSSVTVAEGETASVTNADTGTSYDITVDSLNYGESGGGSSGGGSTASGHTIKVLSINTQNGTDTTTLEIDGTTYADKAVGAQFTTDWGQVRIMAIDSGGQTVTILHGDNTLVLHVGQTIEK